MSNFIKKLKKLKFNSATIGFAGISVELGVKEEKEITPEHLKELYVIRKILSRFYFLYQVKEERQWMYETEDADNQLIIGLHQDAINTYKQLADVLIESKYFMLLNSEQRDNVLETFDYITITEERLNLELEAGNFCIVDEEEITPLVDGLLNLFEEVSKEIKVLQGLFQTQNA